jgi:hypothetical protein
MPGSNCPRWPADISCVSGRLMLQGLIDGQRDPAVLAIDLAKRRLRAKIPDRRSLIAFLGGLGLLAAALLATGLFPVLSTVAAGRASCVPVRVRAACGDTWKHWWLEPLWPNRSDVGRIEWPRPMMSIVSLNDMMWRCANFIEEILASCMCCGPMEKT